VKKRLTKADLAAEVLKRIRAREGCEGVSRVVLEEKSDDHCNWDISVVDAVDAADPLAVAPAIDEKGSMGSNTGTAGGPTSMSGTGSSKDGGQKPADTGNH
jgi:hypothetical protein